MILVTGSSGFVGSHLVDQLLEQGEKVRGVDVRPPHRKDFDFAKVDIRSYRATLKAVRGAEFVYHLAALTSHRLSLRRPQIYTDTNIMGTRNVLEACRKNGVRKVVFSSSSSIYGRPAPNELPLRENSPARPMGPYAISKLAGENYCYFYNHALGLPTVTLRYFNVIGPRARNDICITIFADRILKGLQPIVFGNQTTRDFTDVRDTVKATMLSMERDEAVGQIINVGAGRETKVSGIAQMTIDALGKRGKIEPLVDDSKLSPHEAVRHFSDISKAKQLLKWQPRFSAKDAIEEYAKWIKTKV